MKIIEYENDRIKLELHPKPVSTQTKRTKHISRKRNKSIVKSKRNYVKSCKATYDKVFAYKLEDERCVSFTLTTNEKIDNLKFVLNKYENFLRNVHKHFKDIAVARALESSKNDYVHIHVLIQLKNVSDTKKLTKNFIKKYWQIGAIYLSKKNLYAIGFLDYICKINDKDINDYDKKSSKFPSGVHIFSVKGFENNNFKSKDSDKNWKAFIEEKKEEIKKNYPGERLFVKYCGHIFCSDSIKKEFRYCLDKVYLHKQKINYKNNFNENNLLETDNNVLLETDNDNNLLETSNDNSNNTLKTNDYIIDNILEIYNDNNDNDLTKTEVF